MAEQVLQQGAGEGELVERARRRDPVAVRMLIKQQNRRLYRIARSIVRNNSDAEDVLQKSHVRAFAGLDEFPGRSPVRHLARPDRDQRGASMCAPSQADNRDRPRRGQSLVERPDHTLPQREPRRRPGGCLAPGEIRALLERAIDRLPDGFREILVARLIEGMSVDEAADAFGILPQTVKTRLFRARALLRAEIEKDIGPVLGDAFPFAGRRCDRLTDTVLARLNLT